MFVTPGGPDARRPSTAKQAEKAGFQARLPKNRVSGYPSPTMRSDQRYVVREAIRRQQGEPEGEPVREPLRRDAREYGRYEDQEPPRREAREYERRDYREPAATYREAAPAYQPPPTYQPAYQPAPAYQPGPAYQAAPAYPPPPGYQPVPGYQPPPGYQQAPAYREPPPGYREPAPHYAERLPSDSYPPPPRPARPLYSVREGEPYGRREIRSSYLAQPHEAGSAYGAGESSRRPLRERAPHREEQASDESSEDESTDSPTAPAWFAVSRATAFFVGCMTLLVLLGELRSSNFSAGGWWIDLAPLPKGAARGLLGLSAAFLILFAFFPRTNGLIRRCGGLCTLGLLGAVGWNLYRYYHVAHAGQSFREVPIPFAVHVAALLLVVLPGQLSGWWDRTNFFKDFFVGTVTLATCVVSFPLATFACVGLLDDRGAIDPVNVPAAVVLAGRADAEHVAADNREGNPLQRACQLYRDGQIKKLLLVARPSETAAGDETLQSLRRAVLDQGIPEADVLSQPAAPAASGDSRATLSETAKFLDAQKLSHVLIVARFFEVPRVRLSFERAGLDVHAAPIREDIRPAQMRPVLAREAAAFWMSYVQLASR